MNNFENSHLKLRGLRPLACRDYIKAWGVKHITLIDNARVSYSNPVRQSLFRFKDCLEGGKPKATTAAQALLEIVPSASIQSYNLTVPMPGHLVTQKEEKEVQETTRKIEELVSAHDVVFMLMDTREGRWLPTLLSTYCSKLSFSVALGFDSYVVIRHGWRPNPSVVQEDQESATPMDANIPGNMLGCYFCSDVTAPGNYANRGWEFLRDVFNSPKTLETITGLDNLRNASEQVQIWELSDTESVKSMD